MKEWGNGGNMEWGNERMTEQGMRMKEWMNFEKKRKRGIKKQMNKRMKE